MSCSPESCLGRSASRSAQTLTPVRPMRSSLLCSRGEGTEGARLSEIYAKLEEIEADKAPAR